MKLDQAGIQVVGVSYDPVDVLARFAKRREISFPLLSDSGSKVIEAFGIRNESREDGLPHPGTFLIGADGRVKAKLFHQGYRKRHVTAEIIRAAGVEAPG